MVYLDAPNATNITLYVADIQPINWSIFGTIAEVNLSYSNDSDSGPWIEIINNENASNGTYNWTVPDDIGNAVRVKVTDSTNPGAVYDISDWNMTIAGKIGLAEPTGGEQWLVDTEYPINWTPYGTFDNVTIIASNDSFSSSNWTIAASIDAGDNGTLQTYNYTVPDEISDTVTIRIYDSEASRSNLTTNTSNDFYIRGNLTVKVPNGGQVWYANDTQSITWDANGTLGDINITLRVGSGIYVINDSFPSSGPGSGIYPAFDIYDNISSESCKINLTSTSDENVSDDSNAVFSIRPKLNITWPTTGTQICLYSDYQINWTYVGTNVTYVDIKYFNGTDGSYNYTIAGFVDVTDGNIAWNTTPYNLTQIARIRIIDNSTGTPSANVYGVSNPFEITGKIVVDEPPDASEYEIQDPTHIIKWNATGVDSICYINYSLNGGTSWTNIKQLLIDQEGIGTTFWNVSMPDQVSNEARIEIISSTKPATYYSTGDFYLIERLNLTGAINETGGVVVACGDDVNINWTTISANALDNVTLWYNNTTGWVQIGSGNISNNGSGTYSWSVPTDVKETGYKIRIRSALNPNNEKESGAFTVKPNFTITAPASSPSWDAGSAYDINWTYLGPVDYINLEYSWDSGGEYNTSIVDDYTAGSGGSGGYNWTLPASITLTPTARIQIYDNNTTYSSYTIENDADFTVKGAVSVTFPDGGENLSVLTNYTINWTRFGDVVKFNISYSNNSDSGPWIPIATNLDNTSGADQQYNWTVPDDIGSTTRIRVYDANNPTEVYNSSEADFLIVGRIDINEPTGSTVWRVSDTHPINWTPFGTFDYVKIIASTDNFSVSNWTIYEGAAGSNGTTQSYDYSVPDEISDTVAIRIYNNDTSMMNLTTNTSSEFSIRGKLLVKSPNGDEIYYANDTQSITWDVNGTIGDINITLRVGSGVYIIDESFASGGSGLGQSGIYPSWTIFDNISSGSCKINLTDADESTVSDDSNNTFWIRPKLNITFPGSGDSLAVKDNYQINWTYVGTNVTRVDIKYFNGTDGDYNYTIAGFLNVTDLNVAWNDTTYNKTDVARIRIIDNTTGSPSANVYGVGNPFSLRGKISVDEPIGGGNYEIQNNELIIKWNATALDEICYFNYSLDGGSSWNPIKSLTISSDGPGTTYWNVSMPHATTTTAQVRIYSSLKPTLIIDTTANFSLIERLNLTGPINETGGVVIPCDASVPINWTTISTTAISNVTLWYNNTSGWVQIGGGNISNNGSGIYYWDPPDDVKSASYKIKIENPNDAANYKESGFFTVRPNITITNPTSSSDWTAGTEYPINWTYSGAVTDVNIEYSSDGGASWAYTIAENISSGAAGSGIYNWTIGDDVNLSADTARVRVYDNTSPWDTLCIGTSDNFTTKGTITLNSPDGGETITALSAYEINWSRSGKIVQFNISYSNDSDSGPWNSIVTELNNTSGSIQTYDWTVPDDIATAVRVRVYDANDPNQYDTSSANFSIIGGLALHTPPGGTNWLVDWTYAINWTPTGTFSNVTIEASTNNFSTNWTIYEGAAGTSGEQQDYNYTVVDQISDTVRVRVYDSNTTGSRNQTINTSDEFYIKGDLMLKSPDGNEVWYANDTQSITWDVNGTVGDINITLRVGSGIYIINDSFASGGSGQGQSGIYPSWKIFDNISSSNCRVNITSDNASAIGDESNNTFSIRPKLNITFPGSGDNLYVKDNYQINWTAIGTNVTKVDIRYFNGSDGTYNYTIAGFINVADGNVAWNDTTYNITDVARIRIIDNSTGSPSATTYGMSDPFSLIGKIYIDAPVGAGNYEIQNNELVIQWNATGLDEICYINYSLDGGSSWNPIKSLTISSDGPGTTYWNVSMPHATSTTGKVKIYSSLKPTLIAAETGNFSLIERLNLTGPINETGGVVIPCGATVAINWTTISTTALPNITLWYDNTSGWAQIGSGNISNNGSGTYDWSVPTDVKQTGYKIKIENPNDSNNYKESGTFVVRPNITVTNPTGSPSWDAGTGYDINWTYEGPLSFVDIEYSSDGGGEYNTTIVENYTAGSADSGGYNWTIPSSITLSTTARVQIYDNNTTFSGYTFENDANFTVKGAVSVTFPDGGENLTVFENYTINWTRFGDVLKFNISYSNNSDSGPWISIVTNLSNTSGANQQYNWTVPDDIGSATRIRVQDATNPGEVSNISEANFSIIGRLALNEPTGSTAWIVSDTHPINWTPYGTFDYVKIIASTDNFSGSNITIA